MTKTDLDRRGFLEGALRATAGACLLGSGLGALLPRPAASALAAPLRPPGALAEADFLAACLRCGLCVRACPYQTLRLAAGEPNTIPGTPIFTARTIPCEMCEDLPCVTACPSGALDPALTDITKAKMGVAVLVDQENCLNWQGLRCDVCYRVCPQLDQAIRLDERHNARTGKHAFFLPTVHADACTGCGKCEHSCVLEHAAIKVLPLATARGAMGAHYRLGWDEKSKNGDAPLVDAPLTLPIRQPEGRKGFVP